MSKIVIITGASAGIGRAIALKLARERARLVIAARRAGKLEEVAQEITNAGGHAIPMVADVTDEANMKALVDTAVDQFGALDVMICNAGFGIYGAIDALSAEQMRRLMDVNYHGTFLAARAALPVFRRQKHGHVIIVSSIVGKRGVPYMGAYAATKFAQVGLAECLRAEMAEYGVHVSVVLPISTETEFFSVMTRESGTATRAAGPRQEPDDVAAAVVRAIAYPLPEIYPYRMARGLAMLNAVAPGLTDRIVQRWGRKPIPA
jgi:short-subunit dehydrogenase